MNNKSNYCLNKEQKNASLYVCYMLAANEFLQVGAQNDGICLQEEYTLTAVEQTLLNVKL